MLPVVDDPSSAAGAASFPDADAYGNGDSEDIDYPADPNPNPAFSSSAATAAAPAPAPAAAVAGERRPLFQRLWTEEDEIVILRAFSEFTAQRGTAFASHQYDTEPFYEEMRGRLQLDFSKSQLVEKLRRLKRKYRNCVDRLRGSRASFSFRSPHEQAVFEIARNIWRPSSDKHARDPSAADSDDEGNLAVAADANGEAKSPSSSRGQRRGRRRRTADFTADAAEPPQPYPPAPMPFKTEDSLPQFFPQAAMDDTNPAGPPATLPAANTESSVLTPLFKEMVRAMLGMGGCPAPLGLGAAPEPPSAILGIPMEGEKWRQQRILELEVYLRRIDLLQDQVKSALEELKSTPAT